jgi:hypothetical protein
MTATATHPALAVETLDHALLHDRGEEAACLLCGGETFQVQRRNGARAEVCRECGTSLETEVAVNTDGFAGATRRLRVA